MSRSSYAYQPNTQKDALVIQALLAVSEQYPRYGFKKLFIQLRKKGFTWNHKRVHRVYCLLKLNIKRKGKKRLPSREAKVLVKPETVNTTWSADFMSDSLVCGRRFRTFNVIDDYNREILAIEIDLSFPAQRVIQVLDNIVAVRGYPHKIRLDNGPEFISLALAD
ncbi:MAG: IS3 family transposase IS1400 [Legionellaceae bacterium]